VTLAGADALGEPPVHHLHLAKLTKHHVLGLYVAVHDAMVVCVGDSLAHVEGRAEELKARIDGGSFGDGVCEGATAHEAHDIERSAVWGVSGVIDGHDARVIEGRGHTRLIGESLCGTRVCGEIGADDLEGDVAVEDVVVGDEHVAHTAAPDEPSEDIAFAVWWRWVVAMHNVGDWRPRAVSVRT